MLRQMCQAAKAIGNTELENKFAEGTYFTSTVQEVTLEKESWGGQVGHTMWVKDLVT